MSNYAQMVGERLRNIRTQKSLSLHDVERTSKKEFKASVLGAYERGERSISVPRLQRLANFYAVPVDQLLPRTVDAEDAPASTTGADVERIIIDLERLELVDSPEKPVIKRYLNLVQMQRGDYNGKILTIRKEDLRAMASVLDVPIDVLSTRLDGMGIRAEAASF